MTSFPERVWDRAFTGGWSSRPATDEDFKRRRLLAEVLASETPMERRAEINAELGYVTHG